MNLYVGQLVADEKFPYSRRVTTPQFRAAMVQRLARSPFKAKIRVRFPLAVPKFFLSLRMASCQIHFGRTIRF